MTTSREWTFGTHSAVFEAPDTLRVRFEGPLTVEHATRALEIYAELAREHSYFLLADIKDSSLDAAARKVLGDGIRPEWFRGVVYVGASMILKVVTKALTILVLFNNATGYEVLFADSVDQARELIAKWRAAGQQAPKPASRPTRKAS